MPWSRSKADGSSPSARPLALPGGDDHTGGMNSKEYQSELERLQVELAKVQHWVQTTGARIVVLFEGRDAAGKGGAIKRITERMNPRVSRVVALAAPNEQ